MSEPRRGDGSIRIRGPRGPIDCIACPETGNTPFLGDGRDWRASTNAPAPAVFAEPGTLRMGVRGYEPETDAGVVLDPWQRQLESIPARDLHPRIFVMDHASRRAHLDEVIRPLLLRCPPIVACAADHPEQVFGWCCAEHQGDRQVLHFVYVRSLWRQKGVATRLLRYSFPRLGQTTIYVTHPTRMMRHFAERWRLRFNPYLVR